ncbi:MAG: LysM peptidoglycan-binding domain-containing protein [Planctomycetes bacterium]|nr:LysM peptidoglycan-binding domain-containing protein [Planctomycetota bacterium]MBL7037143.1 LysM peptidoglycan-binding domain-containing protein [Pirellulaceae bacterium]
METIKTAVVVLLLLAVLFGVYVVLNKPQLGSSTDVAWEQDTAPELEVDTGTPVDPAAPSPDEQQGFGVPSVTGPEPMPVDSSFPEPDARVTDQRPTPADPPFGSTDEPTSAPPLTPITEEYSVPETTDSPESAKGPTYQQPGEGSITTQSADGTARMSIAYNDPPADPVQPLHLDDEPSKAAEPQTNRAFENAWSSAAGQLEKGQWAEALYTLSLTYNDPDVRGEERDRLLDLLDPLAGKVIYSSEYALVSPHEVQQGDTLQGIAARYQVPMILLQNINGIPDPTSLQPGTQLKVLRGPFRAEVDRKRSELVLFLGRYYAGRFPISIGNDPDPESAEYTVETKQPGREYFTRDRMEIPAKAPENPYGDWWIGLGGDVCIHGDAKSIANHGSFGCVRLSSADAADVYHILSVGSKVVIR